MLSLNRWALLVLFAVLAAGCAADGDVRADVDRLERELSAAQQRIMELEADNSRLEEQLASQPDDEPVDDPPQPEPDEDDGVREAGAPTGEHAEMIRTPEGLTDQLRQLFSRGDLPDGWQPVTTEWESFELPDNLADGGFDELGLFALALQDHLDALFLGLDTWESTIRALPGDDPDEGHVAVLGWGFADDSIEGRDVLVELEWEDGGWQPVDAQVRYHCRRGMTNDNLCT